jgi:hypothetical protein
MNTKLCFAPGEIPAFAFCEPRWAVMNAPWCIRPITATGLHLGGGVDTQSLCGRVHPVEDMGSGGGWDLNVRLSKGQLARACPKCVAEYRKRRGE